MSIADSAHGRMRVCTVYETGDDETARRRLRGALERCRALGIRAILTDSLLGLAVLTARAGRGEDAARLVGAATGERHPWPPDRFETHLERTACEAAGLEPAAWERGVAEGRQLSAPARLELALADA